MHTLRCIPCKRQNAQTATENDMKNQPFWYEFMPKDTSKFALYKIYVSSILVCVCISAHLGSIEKETVYNPYSSLESENFIWFFLSQTKIVECIALQKHVYILWHQPIVAFVNCTSVIVNHNDGGIVSYGNAYLRIYHSAASPSSFQYHQ